MTPAPRVALVTGATAGFGAAITRRLVRDGWSVVATGRRQARLDALAGELGEAVLPFALDVTDAEAVGALPAALPAAWRDVEALVNNAGLALGLDPAQTAQLADWDRMVAVDVTGMMHVTRALLPGMVARNRGHIVSLGEYCRDISLSRRACLWREQGVRGPVHAELEGRSGGESRYARPTSSRGCAAGRNSPPYVLVVIRRARMRFMPARRR